MTIRDNVKAVGGELSTFADRIVATSGITKTYGHGIVRLESQITATDPAFKNGDYTEEPAKGLEAFGMVWAPWLYSQEWWRKELWKTTAPPGTTLEQYMARLRNFSPRRRRQRSDPPVPDVGAAGQGRHRSHLFRHLAVGHCPRQDSARAAWTPRAGGQVDQRRHPCRGVQELSTFTPNGYNLQISAVNHATRLTLSNAVRPKGRTAGQPMQFPRRSAFRQSGRATRETKAAVLRFADRGRGFALIEPKAVTWYTPERLRVGSVETKDPLRRVLSTQGGLVVETRQHRARIDGAPSWWADSVAPLGAAERHRGQCSE
jgi:hypothetical protein